MSWGVAIEGREEGRKTRGSAPSNVSSRPVDLNEICDWKVSYRRGVEVMIKSLMREEWVREWESKEKKARLNSGRRRIAKIRWWNSLAELRSIQSFYILATLSTEFCFQQSQSNPFPFKTTVELSRLRVESSKAVRSPSHQRCHKPKQLQLPTSSRLQEF